MTVQEVIDALSALPESEKNLPLNGDGGEIRRIEHDGGAHRGRRITLTASDFHSMP